MRMMSNSLIIVVGFLSLCQLSLCGLSSKWDHFTFAQAWPPGTCADAVNEHHTCYIAMKVKTWTIHGLWPTLGSEKGPFSCNNSLKFDFSKIAIIQNDLDTYWPNIYNDTQHDQFWAHEWQKHGTCCQDLPATMGELHYFQAGLMLNHKYNVSKMLEMSGIVPSETQQYSYEDFMGAIQKATNVKPLIQCATKKLKNGTTYHLISQVQICLNKNFTVRSCYPDSHPIKFADTSLKGNYTPELNEKFNLIGHHKQHEPQSSCPRKYDFYYPPVHDVPSF